MRKISKKGLHKQLWDRQSKKMRQSAANFQDYVECYTCLVMINWKEAQIGHFWHNKLDFDKRNLKIQCVRCNHYLHGNLGAYAKRLIIDYGVAWYDQLEKDKNSFKGYSMKELQLISNS